MATERQLRNKISEVISKFDFQKVHQYMKDTNWTWVIGGEERVPNVDELEFTAVSLLSKVVESDLPAYNASTGGFTAYKLSWGLSLHFSFESSKSY